jgi:RimJ/RimL family protein N-acetyltransferase
LVSEVTTDRLLLRRWREDDKPLLAEIYEQPEYLATMPPADPSAQIEAWERRWDEGGFGPWAACDRVGGHLIGRIGLLRHHDWPLGPDPVEVGWVLHRDYWGRGLATEGGRASVAFWREHLADERLYSFTVPSNVRSRAVMERLGMRYGGVASWRGRDHAWYVLDRAGAA